MTKSKNAIHSYNCTKKKSAAVKTTHCVTIEELHEASDQWKYCGF